MGFQPGSKTRVSSAISTGSGALSSVGAGTLLVILAKTMPEGSLLKDILLWAAPSVTIIFNMLWLWAKNNIVRHFEQDIKHYFERRKFEKETEEVLRDLREMCQLPLLNHRFRRGLRKQALRLTSFSL